MNSPMGLELRQSPSEHTPVPRRSLRTLQRSHSALQLNNSPDVLRDELTGDKKRAKLLVSTPHDRKPEIDCISPGTLSDVVQGKYKEEIDRFDIVDCRYPFEYESGHVRGATNIYLPSELEARFLSNPVYPVPGGKRHILIFHCEFSSNRAPSMWQHLRELDRQINAENYPNLFYPEMYVVRGGYKDIHESQPHLCEPYGYTSMFDRGFKAERSRFTCLVKKNKSKKK